MTMKKRIWTLLPLFLSPFAVAACGTGSSTSGGAGASASYPPNEPYTSMGSVAPDASFAFQSSLPSTIPLYPESHGRIFYVANTGNSTNDGLSPEHPLKTLSDANALSLIAGDKVLFKKGDTFVGKLTYSGVSGNDDNPITISSYGEGALPILTDNTSGDVVSFFKSSNIVIHDIEVDVVGVSRATYPSDCRTGINFRYEYVNAKYRNIYIVDNVVKGDDVLNNIMGISISSLERTVADSPNDVLTHCVISHNEVTTLGRSGIKASGWLAQEKINNNNANMLLFHDFHFDNNVVHNTGCQGIFICACTQSTINRNLIYDTGMFNVNQVMEGVCGIMTLGDDDCQVMYNECYSIHDQLTGYDSMGIDIDWKCNNIDVRYNNCHDCQGPGIGTMSNYNSFIRDNRCVDNQCATNQPASIMVCSATVYYTGVPENMHSVVNLKIDNNLIIQSIKGQSCFGTSPQNGDPNFTGDEFTNNHVVFTPDNPKQNWFVNVDPETPWYKFANNQYYSNNLSAFKVSDSTKEADLNSADGAVPYVLSRDDNFGAWAKRDLGATYTLISNEIPANPTAPNVTFTEGKLHFSWTAGHGDIWHYNLFECGATEEPVYNNMIGQSDNASFDYEPTISGDRYYVIQPESSEGVYGRALKVKVSL